MYVYMYVHVCHTCTYIHTCTCLHYMHTCMYMYVCTYTFTHMSHNYFYGPQGLPMIAFHEVNIELIYYILVSHTVYIHVFICW